MNRPEDRFSGALAVVGVFVLTLVFYVLSLGPVFRVVGTHPGHRVDKVLEVVYWPVIAAVERSENVRAVVLWYVKLWERK